ncbi:copper-binding protein [Duganella sp. LX20W]|uniref:Copper-binding protein n=1 Tax=Rugamonas brunnea TaxID=2758569 RepID=A0A7W2IDS1_9BURK|nr:copper-binding protein [Rugamonas brunnea]MBA5639719.1 copper-binding protein [Rugamonas brunnea]
MKHLHNVVLATFIAGVFTSVSPLCSAQQASAAVAPAAMSEGEIRKVDKDAGTLTIKHGELKNLGMGAMTMVFKAQDPAMLNQVKQGDKVRFVANMVNGVLTVSTITVVK